ncbi:SLC25A11 [Cordylochernes scorpioides]|uniref:SLC25A11 n=1 Tax=Cordylochernes scorpioides TaxID=51811 RepID=A0ABY6KIA1_9ARAC|nr:SLC25A11 [Cordylochernes scorpioides]
MGATFFVQPLDLVKNRMQLSGMGGAAKEHKTSLHLIRSVIQQEGFFGLYAGLSAGLLRQASYTTVRMGVYTPCLKPAARKANSPTLPPRLGWGWWPGLLELSSVTSRDLTDPDDSRWKDTVASNLSLCLRLPPAERRGYKNVFNALFRITKEEGVLTLWRGCIPTIGRAMVVNAAQLASYSQAKQILLNSGCGVWAGWTLSLVGIGVTSFRLPHSIP